MFVTIGPGDYINLDNISRCDFKTGTGGIYQATIYFCKTGGADRHFVEGEPAKNLEEALKKLDPEYVAPKKVRKKK